MVQVEDSVVVIAYHSNVITKRQQLKVGKKFTFQYCFYHYIKNTEKYLLTFI